MQCPNLCACVRVSTCRPVRALHTLSILSSSRPQLKMSLSGLSIFGEPHVSTHPCPSAFGDSFAVYISYFGARGPLGSGIMLIADSHGVATGCSALLHNKWRHSTRGWGKQQAAASRLHGSSAPIAGLHLARWTTTCLTAPRQRLQIRRARCVGNLEDIAHGKCVRLTFARCRRPDGATPMKAMSAIGVPTSRRTLLRLAGKKQSTSPYQNRFAFSFGSLRQQCKGGCFELDPLSNGRIWSRKW